MAYTATTWVDNVTQGNHTTMNNLETQYSQATTSFERDLLTPFVHTGLACTKDGTIANQLDVTAGVAFLLQSADSTLQRRAPTATTFTTATPSTTYYLFLNADGTWTWGTTSSGPSNSLAICQATTDASGNILVVTDKRPVSTNLFSGSLATIRNPVGNGGGALTWWMQWDAVNNRTELFEAGQSSMGLALVYVDSGGSQRVGLDIAQDGSGGVGANAAAPLRGTSVGVQWDALGTLSGKAGAGTPGSGMAAALASGTALGIGVYKYVVTFISALGESLQQATPTSVTTTTGNQDVTLSAIPTGPTGTTGRNLYRTAVGGSVYKLLHALADNTTTTYSDTTADGSLGAQNPPTHPSIGGAIWQNNGGTKVAQVYGDGAMSFDSGKITSDGAGNLSAVGFQTNRNGVVTPVAFYTGTSTPVGDGVTTPQTGAVWWGA